MILNTESVKERLIDKMTTVGVVVFAAGDRDLKLNYGKIFPAVYVLRQISSAAPGGSSRLLVQNFHVTLEVGIVAQKYQEGSIEGELRRRELVEDVFASLSGWTPPDASLALSLIGYTDGDPADTVNYGVMKWSTEVFFRGVAR